MTDRKAVRVKIFINGKFLRIVGATTERTDLEFDKSLTLWTGITRLKFDESINVQDGETFSYKIIEETDDPQ